MYVCHVRGVVVLREKQVCVCYTSDLQTSPIFTVEYYKGVAKSAAEAGAHMIGIKVSERRHGKSSLSLWLVGRCVVFLCLWGSQKPAKCLVYQRSEKGSE